MLILVWIMDENVKILANNHFWIGWLMKFYYKLNPVQHILFSHNNNKIGLLNGWQNYFHFVFRIIHCRIQKRRIYKFSLNIKTSSQNACFYLEIVAFSFYGLFQYFDWNKTFKIDRIGNSTLNKSFIALIFDKLFVNVAFSFCPKLVHLPLFCLLSFPLIEVFAFKFSFHCSILPVAWAHNGSLPSPHIDWFDECIAPSVRIVLEFLLFLWIEYIIIE